MLPFLTMQDPQQFEVLKGEGGYGQLPPAASTFASDVDGLFLFCWAVSVFFFVLIAVLLLYTTIVHRRKRDDQPAASDMTHNTPLEVVWTIIPTIILMVIFAWGWKGNVAQSIAPGDALQFRAVARQWSWSFFHPGSTTASTNEFWVPIDTPVKFTTNSEDVLHSFYVPAFRAKRDVLPGRYQTVWFRATEFGKFPLFCAEYCGASHSNMIATVHVVTPEEFATKPWEKIPDDPIVYGEQFYKNLCVACHTLDGSKLIGPSFKGIWGREEELADGTRVTVDEAYVTESIRNPMAKIVKDYPPVMAAYGEEMIPDAGIAAIIEFLKVQN